MQLLDTRLHGRCVGQNRSRGRGLIFLSSQVLVPSWAKRKRFVGLPLITASGASPQGEAKTVAGAARHCDMVVRLSNVTHCLLYYTHYITQENASVFRTLFPLGKVVLPGTPKQKKQALIELAFFGAGGRTREECQADTSAD